MEEFSEDSEKPHEIKDFFSPTEWENIWYGVQFGRHSGITCVEIHPPIRQSETD